MLRGLREKDSAGELPVKEALDVVMRKSWQTRSLQPMSLLGRHARHSKHFFSTLCVLLSPERKQSLPRDGAGEPTLRLCQRGGVVSFWHGHSFPQFKCWHNHDDDHCQKGLLVRSLLLLPACAENNVQYVSYSARRNHLHCQFRRGAGSISGTLDQFISLICCCTLFFLLV